MPNTIALASVFQSNLDALAVRGLRTGWMEANAGQVKYNGGNEVKIPKMTLSGLGNYDRSTGYPVGSIAVEYETKQMTQDRGRQFNLDAQDVDETNFAVTAAGVLAQFQNDNVIPEVDAYRIAKLYGLANTAGHVTEYTPAASDILAKLKADITAARDAGAANPVIQISIPALGVLETALASQLHAINWKVGGVDTQVPAIDGCPLIATESDRMVKSVTISATNGFTGSGVVNWIVMGRIDPIAVCKTDKIRIWTPDQNQDADAWKLNFRKYHDLWVMDKKIAHIRANAQA